MTTSTEYRVRLRRPHASQRPFVESPKPRIILRAGRRGGKTTGIAIKAAQAFLAGKRVLYATPTSEQIGRFWFEVTRSLEELIDSGTVYKNETQHIIEFPGTEQRIRAKTAWNANTLRGDHADLLILDEWQLIDEEAWEIVGAPMLLDNNGDAVFIYTPPSLHSRSISKARDPRHAAKMYKMASSDTSGRWAAFHFSSHDNPHISEDALVDITSDMTSLAYRQEILAEDIDELPGALWTRANLDNNRVAKHPDLSRVVVGVDPPGGATECGIVVAGLGADGHGYVLEDRSLKASPERWAREVLTAYAGNDADRILGEDNYGGDMVESTVKGAARSEKIDIRYKAVKATRGKAVRAEPVAALYERGQVHHVGLYPLMEDELCNWMPGESSWSPNRLDALVWALTELMVKNQGSPGVRFL